MAKNNKVMNVEEITPLSPFPHLPKVMILLINKVVGIRKMRISLLLLMTTTRE